MERIIFHSDINSCYANIELLYRPELRGKPMAVAGDPGARHGIVLAKEELAKKAGVKTGMALWQARKLCPELVFVAPRMELYLSVTRQIRRIYSRYTDRQESFGIDESWLDLTGSITQREGPLAAEELRRCIKSETGLTVSVGVSWNKIFAKLGSDYRKPDAVTVINRANYRDVVWPLPVEELLYVGPATKRRLNSVGISTIGELANTEPELLHCWLGKNGYTLFANANGLDVTPVRHFGEEPPEKSIGNSTTTSCNLETEAQLRSELMALCECVGMRLRQGRFLCRIVEVSLRSAQTLHWSSHQTKLERASDLTGEIFSASERLCFELWDGSPIRSIGVRVCALSPAEEAEQLCLFEDEIRRDNRRRLDAATDAIRERFGFDCISRGLSMSEPGLRDGHSRENRVSVFGLKDRDEFRSIAG